jgi:hypothetical protein
MMFLSVFTQHFSLRNKPKKALFNENLLKIIVEYFFFTLTTKFDPNIIISMLKFFCICIVAMTRNLGSYHVVVFLYITPNFV